MSSTVLEILGAQGAISRRMGDLYEHRPQQLEMASAVERALADGRHLLVEAGTGVGKSFAYLLPVIDYAVKKKKRVVISTHTIALQEQLIEKDIPLIQSVYDDEFTAVLVKGRNNYLCRRRLQQAGARQALLFDYDSQLKSLAMIQQWSQKTSEGSLADLPDVPDPGVWDRVCAEHGNCLGAKCEFIKGCFWQSAKRRMRTGNILIVNHALFFSDLALRLAGINYLPKYDVAVLDEAHTIEDVAGSHFGLKVTEYGLRYQLRMLYDPKRSKGMLNSHGGYANQCIQDVDELYEYIEAFFQHCTEWQKISGRSSGRMHEADVVQNDVSPKLRELSLHLKAILPNLTQDQEIAEMASMSEKVAVLADSLDAILSQKIPDGVYWMEFDSRSRRIGSLHAAPVKVSDGLRTHLFEKTRSVIMCSATLCTADSHGAASFEYIKSRLGAETADTLVLGSPFDYATQATLYIETDLPEPNDTLHFMPAACERILHYLQQTNGGAFVLFTSFAMLGDAATRLADDLARLGYPLLVQGKEAPRKVLLERFRNTPNAVLLGTSSFWQGIDVRGDALRNVIIVKLPFAVPDEPLVEARIEAITREGGNAFMQYSVPEAIIKLKQGFGRLIRSRSDKGIVVILDSRVKQRRYGRMFLDALPACKRVIVNNRPQGEK